MYEWWDTGSPQAVEYVVTEMVIFYDEVVFYHPLNQVMGEVYWVTGLATLRAGSVSCFLVSFTDPSPNL